MGGIVEVDAEFEEREVAISQVWSLDWLLLGRGGRPNGVEFFELSIED